MKQQLQTPALTTPHIRKNFRMCFHIDVCVRVFSVRIVCGSSENFKTFPYKMIAARFYLCHSKHGEHMKN